MEIGRHSELLNEMRGMTNEGSIDRMAEIIIELTNDNSELVSTLEARGTIIEQQTEELKRLRDKITSITQEVIEKNVMARERQVVKAEEAEQAERTPEEIIGEILV